jgi:hypothetical protein
MDGRRIDGQRPGGGLERLGTPAPDRAADVRRNEFESLLPAKPRGRVAGTAPKDAIAEFILPEEADASLFQNGRPLAILTRLVDEIIPSLEESDELRALAAAVVHDEIARQRDLIERLQNGTAA